ncbi:hydrophobic surface binding protein [Mycena crocata]|nr:hydrophobic surface binding protein [Mycena crocata]
MVQLSRLRVAFSLSLLATYACFATSVKRTVAQVQADISSISSQVTTLDNDINGFPASGLVGALGIHTAAGNLETSLNQGTTDVKATGAVSEADGRTILNSVTAFEPKILDALKAIATKRAAFMALPVAGIPALVLQDLQTLRSDTGAFASALVASAPADLKSQATSIQSTIDAAFATAIAAYQ